jgi:TatD DNase family protein
VAQTLVTQEYVNLTDTHCHLDLEHFNPDREAVIERAIQAGIERILIPGLSLISSRAIVKLVALASGLPRLYAAIGVHPTEAGTWDSSTRNELKNLITSPIAAMAPDLPETGNMTGRDKIVAVGEIGLDYYWETTSHDLQKTILQEQLELAAEMGYPVLLHMREGKDAPTGPCAADLLELLRKWVNRMKENGNPLAEQPGVLHSFSGSVETAREAIELGFYIGVSGPVTFTNAQRRQEIVSQLPLDRLLTETDAPFLAPHPHRGQRNEPAYVRLIADKIALLHSSPTETVAETTCGNAFRLLKWK